MNKKNCFYLGQIYGKLRTVNPDWFTPQRFERACARPLNGTTQYYLATQKKGLLNKNTETYIKLAFNAINTDELEQPIDQPISLDLQGTFRIGMYKGMSNQSPKELIDRIGKTQEEIAETLGVKRLAVGTWYRGEVKISEKTRFFLVNFSDLLDGTISID